MAYQLTVEQIEFLKFVVEKSKKTTKLFTWKELSEEYVEKTKSSKSPDSVVATIYRNIRPYLSKLENFDIVDQVRIIFFLGFPIPGKKLRAEIKKSGTVSFGKKFRIEMYESNDRIVMLNRANRRNRHVQEDAAVDDEELEDGVVEEPEDHIAEEPMDRVVEEEPRQDEIRPEEPNQVDANQEANVTPAINIKMEPVEIEKIIQRPEEFENIPTTSNNKSRKRRVDSDDVSPGEPLFKHPKEEIIIEEEVEQKVRIHNRMEVVTKQEVIESTDQSSVPEETNRLNANQEANVTTAIKIREEPVEMEKIIQRSEELENIPTTSNNDSRRRILDSDEILSGEQLEEEVIIEEVEQKVKIQTLMKVMTKKEVIEASDHSPVTYHPFADMKPGMTSAVEFLTNMRNMVEILDSNELAITKNRIDETIKRFEMRDQKVLVKEVLDAFDILIKMVKKHATQESRVETETRDLGHLYSLLYSSTLNMTSPNIKCYQENLLKAMNEANLSKQKISVEKIRCGLDYAIGYILPS